MWFISGTSNSRSLGRLSFHSLQPKRILHLSSSCFVSLKPTRSNFWLLCHSLSLSVTATSVQNNKHHAHTFFLKRVLTKTCVMKVWDERVVGATASSYNNTNFFVCKRKYTWGDQRLNCMSASTFTKPWQEVGSKAHCIASSRWRGVVSTCRQARSEQGEPTLWSCLPRWFSIPRDPS